MSDILSFHLMIFYYRLNTGKALKSLILKAYEYFY